MSFHDERIKAQKVAIIGGGISGMAAAYQLAPHHSVTLYEAAQRLGGHARTVTAGRNGDQPVDTGFIVFNEANYPHLTAMFDALDVPTVNSDMSFGATIDNGRIEYGLKTLSALFAQRRNLLRPGFGRMLRDILRFNALAEPMAQDDSATVGELMDELKLGRWFQDYYLTPLCGAIWSTPTDRIRAFPARSLVQFFRNHALLSVRNQHQWKTVSGGSVEYVRRLEAHLRARGVAIRTGTPVQAVIRDGTTSTIRTGQAGGARFDQVIFACHSDDALRLLARPTTAERGALSNLTYQDNHMILHRDTGQMPRRRSVWSSWVYQSDASLSQDRIGVTYWMNRLQNIPERDPLFVSLNPARPVDERLIYDQTTFRHPVFDHAALRAQQALAGLQGQNNTWFAGAYTRHGFHEDGVLSAVRIARALEGTPEGRKAPQAA
ncbi:NAD(P)/FAD-dependent oxidoreductase [Antarcticimicrobium luteum]|uniref:FAD-dependent oxidoreductase n=1 Tax=Antarcticimicrobium luteum TaxID=2547397 RepID=A0A4R5V9I6_9RHOB|nr:FAD-dependent oxidoreductase [Antarcticimicrobium luteum]TDK48799.1 FAD-dependent oxidoreductase [Antarcticimicrobium luteum]